jgi:alanine racemase
LLVVVKANAYGHGEAQAATAAIAGGADWLGVARVSEGLALRTAGITAPILLLAEPPPAALHAVLEFELTPSVYTEETARALHELAQDRGTRCTIHLKVDTGMHRYGVMPSDLGRFLEMIRSLNRLELSGFWTHFAVAEDVLNPYTSAQAARFIELSEAANLQGSVIRHLCNSAATMSLAGAHFDMVRSGIAAYGIHPSPALADRIELEPAMSLHSRIGMVKRLAQGESISYGQRYTMPREGFVATVPSGYADGLPRCLANKAEVLIGGRRYRISGNITMDHFLVDLGDDEHRAGAEVVILGSQGGDRITAQQIADWAGTIPYEIVCGISARVPRVYTES